MFLFFLFNSVDTPFDVTGITQEVVPPIISFYNLSDFAPEDVLADLQLLIIIVLLIAIANIILFEIVPCMV